MIKKVSPELKSLLERISETSKATATELETLVRLNPPLNLKVTHLPKLEQAARESIDKETSKEILHSKGVDLGVQHGEFATSRNELRRASGTQFGRC
jgi:hypothetical protein